MDFETLIYLILGIFWVLLSIYNKNKKKGRKTQPVETETPKEETDIKSILEDILMGPRDSQKKVIPVETIKDTTKSTHRKKVSESQLNTSYKLETKQKTLSERTISKYKKIKIPHIEEEGTFQDDFDIKQAIIYSEILKRPQY